MAELVTVVLRRFVTLAFVACLAGYVFVYSSGRANPPIRSDGFSYYVYLPSWLIYHDLSLQSVADECCGGEFPAWTAIIRWWPGHRWVDAHPIGEAILIAPFFGAAHLLTKWTNLPPDGYSLYYQHGAGLAGLCYVVAGLWCLRRLLVRHFAPGATLATLLTLLAGTSLFHYATFDSVWSHPFAFFLVSAFIERFDRWRPDRRSDAVWLGAISGLITLVRHTNVLLPCCFFGAGLVSALRTRELRRTYLSSLAVVAVTAAAVVLPQLMLYRAATHHWLISAYGQMGFDFSSPHIIAVLFSPAKGLFFWAPVLLFAAAGFLFVPPSLRRFVAPSIVFLLLDTYVIASWWDWQFGASFGHRGFVDVYPLLAVGLAAFYARVGPVPGARFAVATVAVLLCALSQFQMFQYWNGVMPMSDTTWTEYKSLFLKPR